MKYTVGDIVKFQLESGEIQEGVIIGTGESGALPVMDEVKEEAEKRGVTLVITKTEDACRELEKAGGKTNAVLHLTC